jgi:thiol-disulfide isomerase/thioredoxin
VRFSYVLPILLGSLVAGCDRVTPPPIVSVRLTDAVPDSTRQLRWSPKGEQLVLGPAAETVLRLGGPDALPIALRLQRSTDSPYFDQLWIDRDRNGVFDDGGPVTSEPKESRGKIWSSFDAVLEVPVIDPESGQPDRNAYAVAFWFVHDPLDDLPSNILRFSRRGWMQGDAVIDGVPARIMLTESHMDGVFDRRDSWAIAEADSAENVLRFGDARPAERHAWLGPKAYRIISIDPSGRLLTLQHGDVGITRAEEAAQDDKLAADRAAPRSGRSVAFELDFEQAEVRARKESKNLFVDFKTVWCGPCYTMDEWVFTADPVIDMAGLLVAARVDGDERRDLAERFSVGAYPTLLLLSPDGQELDRHVGYLNVDSTALFLRGR